MGGPTWFNLDFVSQSMIDNDIYAHVPTARAMLYTFAQRSVLCRAHHCSTLYRVSETAHVAITTSSAARSAYSVVKRFRPRLHLQSQSRLSKSATPSKTQSPTYSTVGRNRTEYCTARSNSAIDFGSSSTFRVHARRLGGKSDGAQNSGAQRAEPGQCPAGASSFPFDSCAQI